MCAYRRGVGDAAPHAVGRSLPVDRRADVGIGRKGVLPAEGTEHSSPAGTAITRVPLVRGEEPILRNYCAFWKKNNSGHYMEEFAGLLKAQFAE